MKRSHLIKYLTLVALAIFCSVDRVAAQDNFSLVGRVAFWNIQDSLATGAPTYYLGPGYSRLTGHAIQTGSILPTSPPTPDENGNLVFTGVQGPNPFLGGFPIHAIHTRRGTIFCTWEATFTIAPQSPTTAIFSGDGHFTVVGGTRHWRHASGEFTTLFESEVIPLTSDTATAGVLQFGNIDR